MSNFETNKAIRILGASLNKSICELKESLLGLNPDLNPQGGSELDTIQSGSGTPSVTFTSNTPDDNIRLINVILEENTRATIDITLHDGSSWTHNMFGGSYNSEIALNQSPVNTIVVTEIDGVSTRAIINVQSKTGV